MNVPRLPNTSQVAFNSFTPCTENIVGKFTVMDIMLDFEFLSDCIFLGHFLGLFVHQNLDFVAEQIVVQCFGSHV